MSSEIPSVPAIPAAAHHASKDTTIDPHFFGVDAPLKPTLSSTGTIPLATFSSPFPTSSTIKTPIPAKSDSMSSAMSATQTSPTPTPTTVAPNPSSSSNPSIFGWGFPAEIAFFVCLAALGLCLPLGTLFYLRRRRKQAKKLAASEVSSSIDLEGTFSNGTTRPPTASSWLEMLKHRTDTPAPPHANADVYIEPPKPISFARRKFCSRRSGRLSEAEIEREVRELDEEVRRRSKAARSRGPSVGVLPDLEDPCSQCAQSYTHDERGHTQPVPVEGRKATPVPFLTEKSEPRTDETQAKDEHIHEDEVKDEVHEKEERSPEAKDSVRRTEEDTMKEKVDS
ncbi:hypothetical protein ABW21_db0200768 [Orbilia brochopaga]|nr:hypothetical protein ABW21_db0200768 [Drechslerella brochopaga]